MTERHEALELRRTPTSLKALLHTALAVLEVQASSLDVGLTIETANDLPKAVSLDPEKIAWAVTTLVGNALRFVRRGTRRIPGGQIDVSVTMSADSRFVCIAVRDDGPGIPSEKLPWLFVRKEGAVLAAGISLMLVHDVVRAHGGDVEVASRTDAVDHGTTIRLRIPVTA